MREGCITCTAAVYHQGATKTLILDAQSHLATNSIKAATYYISYNANIPFQILLLCFSMEVNPSSFSVSFQDDTNIDAAITCLVKSIMSLEEESATADAAGAKREPDNNVLVLPRFNYSRKERGLGGCSGCSSLKPRH